MPNCPECNFPYEEGQKFCNTCGCKLPVIIKQKICPVCGNTLLENTKVCNICGTPVSAPEDTTAAEELARQQELLKNPTMDEVEIPVITDEMLGLTEEQPNKADMPTMDSIFMPGQQPAQPKPQPKPVQIAKPQPAPQQPVIDQMNGRPQMNGQPQAPQMQNNFRQQNQYQQPAQPAQPVNNQFAPQQNQFAQNPQPQAPQNNFAQPQAVIPQGNGGYQQPNMPQNNPYPQNNMPMNNMGQQNMPQGNQPQNGVTPGKKPGNILPIILIVAIIIVILVDVFVVFRKNIFGDKDTKKSAAVITVADDFTED
ncbi:zinc ribbon domain-containing protein [Ruminococcus sp.]|uniref:zinc ribbon domain-containing protein n=1 Tax=Ruminococcus sp. TaxID=41978 RepID=UPI0025E0190C|nr:zinc ribbon domain-containing protein [Ruminococcus sp.]MBQ8967356.1 zinc ribbon domain-containing protein [Ruminococcus sp.]